MSAFPYTFRICACLPGHEPVELFRTHAAFTWKAWRFWTDDLDSAWGQPWVEYRQPERELLGPRVTFYRPASAGYSNGIKLKISAPAGADSP